MYSVKILNIRIERNSDIFWLLEVAQERSNAIPITHNEKLHSDIYLPTVNKQLILAKGC